MNNGVYRAGFARAQTAYDTAVRDVFDGLDKVQKGAIHAEGKRTQKKIFFHLHRHSIAYEYNKESLIFVLKGHPLRLKY